MHRGACSAEDVERTRQKAAEQSKQSRKGGGSASRNGLEGAAIKISETTGSIIWGATEHAGELAGGSSPTKKSKKERREKRDKREKRREKDSRHGGEEVPRPSKGKKGSGSKRRPKVGA